MPDAVLASVWGYVTRTITGLDPREDSLLWEIIRGSAVAITKEESSSSQGIAFSTTYADKAIRARLGDAYTKHSDSDFGLVGRAASDGRNTYIALVNTSMSTLDFMLRKVVGGSLTGLASESVDLTAGYQRTVMLSCSGSSIKAFRVDMTTPKLSATDTSLASGLFGVGTNIYDSDVRAIHGALSLIFTARLLSAASPLSRALAIMEFDVEGSGSGEDPYRPALSKSIANHDVYGYIDLDSVTWGTYEFYPDKAGTVVVVVTGDNPYRGGAIERQRTKAKRAFDAPNNYDEAVALYNKLRMDYPHWIAGKDNFAYHVLGLDELDLLQNVDFYYGELIEHKTHYDQLKQVPDWEIRNRLNELIDRLSKVTILTDERDKHIAKAKEILSRGW